MECRNHVLSPGSQIPTSLTYITAFSYFWCFDFRSLCLQLLLFVTKGNNHNYLLLISTFAYCGSFSLFCFICNLSYSAVLKFTTLPDFWWMDSLLLLGALALHPSLSAIPLRHSPFSFVSSPLLFCFVLLFVHIQSMVAFYFNSCPFIQSLEQESFISLTADVWSPEILWILFVNLCGFVSSSQLSWNCFVLLWRFIAFVSWTLNFSG